ncbi:hypothetical protein K502DRAFT_365410 [Neoconidiobolus thromboides FSU 785]|nr:hypothetical protein K502DRAFT_365410 [Neoconidiobolus thromboides FSU 785]
MASQDIYGVLFNTHKEYTMNQIIYDEPDTIYNFENGFHFMPKYCHDNVYPFTIPIENNPFDQSFGNFLYTQESSSPIEYMNKTESPYSSFTSSSSSSTQGSGKRRLTKSNSSRSNKSSKSKEKRKEWLIKKEEENQTIETQNKCLEEQVDLLKNEIINLKMLLASHQGCNF